MRLNSKTPKAAPIVVCLSRGGVLKVKGTPYTFGYLEKLRADHPLVKAYPAMFAEDGLTTAEYNQAAHAWRVAREVAA